MSSTEIVGYLFGAATTQMAFPMVGNRHLVRQGDNLNVHFVILLPQINIGDDTQGILDLIRQFFQKPLSIVYPNNPSVVIDANQQRTALGIGESSDPFEVLVSPAFFIFDDRAAGAVGSQP